jgi:RecB family exonuclease
MSTALMEPLPLPPARLTSYRYWEGRRPEDLRAIRAKLDLVLDDLTRQLDLFAEPQEAAAATKNETLGEILSPSQANTFLNCSAKWWFKYGAGLPDPKGGSLVRGLAVHKTIERWFRLILEGAAPEIDDMREVYDDAWEALSAEASFAVGDDIDELKRSGAVLLRKYLEEAAPEIRPAALEQQVLGEIGGVKVRGYIDIVDVDGNIIDVKTAAKKPSGIDPSYAFQLATYRQLLPNASGKARLDTLVATKTPQLVKIEYQVTAADQLLACKLYPRVREGIREGLYFPNRNSNLCSRKYCNFADACCKEFGGQV